MIELLGNTSGQNETQTRNFGQTVAGRPITWFVDEQVNSGTWREEEIAPEVSGVTRPLKIYGRTTVNGSQAQINPKPG
ncbi:MAG: hypothetical protein ACJ8CB_11380 [Ktedonobacteraceae bacterium]